MVRSLKPDGKHVLNSLKAYYLQKSLPPNIWSYVIMFYSCFCLLSFKIPFWESCELVLS